MYFKVSLVNFVYVSIAVLKNFIYPSISYKIIKPIDRIFAQYKALAIKPRQTH
ncbi:MAG: hypothetical protein R3331_00865 [Sulfurospirillaceae bacterium]|nr:hypothetical protein [Sulfurospirillaceae bacterium]